MKTLIFSQLIIFLFSIQGMAQRTEFYGLNSEGKHFKTYVKIKSGNTTSYTSYFIKGRSIRNITVKTSEENWDFKRYIFEYSYIEDTTQIKDAENIDQFVKWNDPSNLTFKTREIWTFYVRNDSLFRYDLSEYSPTFKGIPRFTQFTYFDYSDSLVELNSYFLKFTKYEQFSKDSILVLENGDLLQRYSLRWEKSPPFISQKLDSIWLFKSDSVIYYELIYEYNREPFWRKLYLMTSGEGPIYNFEIIDMEDKLFKRKYDYINQLKYENKVKLDEKGRLLRIDKFKNEELLQTIRIKYF